MTRKDIIIIAVLVNAGIMAFLFFMAINTDDDPVVEYPSLAQQIVEIPSLSQSPMAIMPSASTLAVGEDELDYVLKDFSLSPPKNLESENLDDSDKISLAVQTTQTSSEPILEPPSESNKIIQVTVKKGDSLDRIARANETTIEAIRKTNQLKTDRLNIGQVLSIPLKTQKVEKVSAVKPPSVEVKTETAEGSSQEYYVIKSGDNPWKIAKQFHVKFDELLKLNNLNEEKARNLKIGDRIRVK